MTTFSVAKSGPLTTFQDGGRFGQHYLGLTEGGPMDYRSFALANRLVGNNLNATTLEITLGGLQLHCLKNTTIALTGAFCPLLINGKPVQLWHTHQVKTGDTLQVGFAALGVRSYLSVCGGFQAPSWFNSSATVIREGLGEAIKTSDQLSTGSGAPQHHKLDFRLQPSLKKNAVLHFVPGYQWQRLSPDNQQLFLSRAYEVSSRNDRMGYQLSGQKINTGITRLYSEGISLGAIQITGDGLPIVLMNDHQTIGGYPKLGSVITADLDKLAQLPAGATVRFEKMAPEQSVKKFREYMSEISTCPFINLDSHS